MNEATDVRKLVYEDVQLVPLANEAYHYRVETIGALIRTPLDRIASWDNVGRRRLDRLERVLARHGLAFHDRKDG